MTPNNKSKTNSIDDLAHMDDMSKLGKVGYVLGRMLLGGMLFLSVGVGYKTCIGPRAIENRPTKIVDTTVTSAIDESYLDQEVGREVTHYVTIDKYDGRLNDRSMKLSKNDELDYIKISKRIIPGSSPVVIDYKLKKTTNE
ncbi:hypothetical protein HN695_05925 [Candidatus Woesearchaeota archaeon]|nr:hypothetical protein [Candidatus Woesearchaeota archaeon]MBT5272581.1 hypothetical protein [Candidatus Woesearchaeota archaeon]MBT6040562.1 hypothetical protein [Candidatus Woesearchaeota archaeon]MBT6337133.1 hypothetical protein [Candidatus Woesearchaeota archaeon]MBT7927847.1 hypothetical protein [Candidatus Woesearchaeota archaeon]